MTVRVELTQKQRLDNHRPEFRPTDSAKLYGSERTLASAVNRIADAIPESLVVDYIFGRVQATSLTRRITDLVEDNPTMIERPLFSGFQVGELDDAAQQRKDINRRLRRLGASVRLRSTEELRKASTRSCGNRPIGDRSTTSRPERPVPYPSRMQSQRILTDLSRSTVNSIDTIVQNSFRVTETFSTGRTVAGLTPTQTAATIFTALDEIGPTPTGADLAARTVHTRGLFPRWALAVERSGNAAGYRAARNGASAERVLDIADRQMRRHGEKLRRARARMIARTEIAVAQNQGILAQQQALIDQGVASPNSQKEWITGPFDVCPICPPARRHPSRAGRLLLMAGRLGVPARPSELPLQDPPPVPTIDSPPQRIGTGTILDPYRYEFPDGWVAPVNPVAPPAPHLDLDLDLGPDPHRLPDRDQHLAETGRSRAARTATPAPTDPDAGTDDPDPADAHADVQARPGREDLTEGSGGTTGRAVPETASNPARSPHSLRTVGKQSSRCSKTSSISSQKWRSVQRGSSRHLARRRGRSPLTSIPRTSRRPCRTATGASFSSMYSRTGTRASTRTRSGSGTCSETVRAWRTGKR